MKKLPLFFFFVVLAGTVSAESAVTSPASPASLRSFSFIPAYTIPIGPDGSLGGGIAGSQWFAPGWSLASSCQYRLPSSPFFIGADLGYSWVPHGGWKSLGIDPYKAWPSYSGIPGDAFVRMSIWQVGLIASLLVEPNMNPAIDKNLQVAIGFHEALRLLGIAYVTPPLASYATASKNKTALGSVKCPLQTLQDRSGDCSDLSILSISLLESMQVETAFVTIPGHVFIAFALASSEEEARKTFSHAEEPIFRDGKVWVPIDVTEREASFLTAWQAGAKEWRKARKQAHFYPIQAGRNLEEPVDSAWNSAELPPLDPAQVAQNFQQEVDRIAAWEIQEEEK
jgi:hypothetical protein